jgi:class 3 adenylate cyclase
VPVLLSDATRAHLTRANGLAEVATIAVKGREQQVRVWTLPEIAEAAPSAASVQRAGN